MDHFICAPPVVTACIILRYKVSKSEKSSRGGIYIKTCSHQVGQETRIFLASHQQLLTDDPVIIDTLQQTWKNGEGLRQGSVFSAYTISW